MDILTSAQFLLDDDTDIADDSDDFDIDFDEDYEYLSDEEFEVSIDYDEYDANDLEISCGEFGIDEMDGFADFDAPDDPLAEKEYDDAE